MTDDIHSVERTASLGDRIRQIADQLRDDTAVQVKATSRILGAAAQLSVNHDQLIDEVVDMVEEDLDAASTPQAPTYTVESLKQQYKTLAAAKKHFGLKANGWQALADKLNAPMTPQPASPSPSPDRLAKIESDLAALRHDVSQILVLLSQLVTQPTDD